MPIQVVTSLNDVTLYECKMRLTKIWSHFMIFIKNRNKK